MATNDSKLHGELGRCAAAYDDILMLTKEQTRNRWIPQPPKVTQHALWCLESLCSAALARLKLAKCYVITVCHHLQAWKVGQDKQVAPLRSFGRFAGGVHCLSLTPGKDWLLSASLDGFVVAWNLETFTPVFRMKFGSAVQGLLFYEQDRFLCRAGNEVMR